MLENTSKEYFRVHKHPFHSMKNPSRRLRAKAKERASKEGKRKLFPIGIVWLEGEKIKRTLDAVQARNSSLKKHLCQHPYIRENSQISGPEMLSCPVQSLSIWPPSWAATCVSATTITKVSIHFANPVWWSKCWTRNVRSTTVQLVDHPSEGSRASGRTASYSKSLNKWCPTSRTLKQEGARF